MHIFGFIPYLPHSCTYRKAMNGGNLNLIVADNAGNIKKSLKIKKENLLPSIIEKKSEKVVNLNLEDQFILN